MISLGTYLNGLIHGCGVKISTTELVLIGGHGIDDIKNPYRKVTKFNVLGQSALLFICLYFQQFVQSVK